MNETACLTNYEWATLIKTELKERIPLSCDVEYSYQRAMLKALDEYLEYMEEIERIGRKK